MIKLKDGISFQDLQMEKGRRVGIAWYRPEQWDRLLEISDDRDSLEMTYSEWLIRVENLLSHTLSQGVSAEKVLVDVEKLKAWCESEGVSITSSSRAKYVSEQLRKLNK